MENQDLMKLAALLLPMLAPYLTTILKKLWALKFTNRPLLNWGKSYVAGVLIASIEQLSGVPLPSDLANLDVGTVTAVLTSGAVIGALGSWARDFFDIMKRVVPAETKTGAVVRLVAGK